MVLHGECEMMGRDFESDAYPVFLLLFFTRQDRPLLLGVPSQMLTRLVSSWNGFLLLIPVEGKTCLIILLARSATGTQGSARRVAATSGTFHSRAA